MMGMVGWRGGDTGWGISEETPSEIDILYRAGMTIRYSDYRSRLVFGNVAGENLQSSFGTVVLRNVAEMNGRNLMRRTFDRVESFGEEIYLTSQI
jgi:hypothetical protein